MQSKSNNYCCLFAPPSHAKYNKKILWRHLKPIFIYDVYTHIEYMVCAVVCAIIVIIVCSDGKINPIKLNSLHRQFSYDVPNTHTWIMLFLRNKIENFFPIFVKKFYVDVESIISARVLQNIRLRQQKTYRRKNNQNHHLLL